MKNGFPIWPGRKERMYVGAEGGVYRHRLAQVAFGDHHFVSLRGRVGGSNQGQLGSHSCDPTHQGLWALHAFWYIYDNLTERQRAGWDRFWQLFRGQFSRDEEQALAAKRELMSLVESREESGIKGIRVKVEIPRPRFVLILVSLAAFSATIVVT